MTIWFRRTALLALTDTPFARIQRADSMKLHELNAIITLANRHYCPYISV